MNPVTYQNLTRRTAAQWCGPNSMLGATIQRMVEWNGRVLTQSMDIFHGIMGLGGEEVELADAIATERHRLLSKFHESVLSHTNVTKELGDILWYVAQIYNGMADDMDKIKAAAEDGELMAKGQPPVSASLFYAMNKPHPQELYKKWIIYGQEVSRADLGMALEKRVALAFKAANELALEFGLRRFSFEEACEVNIAKLRRRFPGNFDANIASSHDGA